MNNKLRKLLAAACLMCGLFFGISAQATHYQGAELTYAYVAPNAYQVNFKVYRDCTGASLSSNYTLSIQCAAGGSTRTVSLLQTGQLTIGEPYCPSSGKNNCSGAVDNYQTGTFSAIVTFTTAEIACGNVRLSTSNSARPSTQNLLGQGNLYSETIINLSAGINNTSPQFRELPVPYVASGSPMMFSAGAIDPDGDSLVYSLQPALAATNTPITYMNGFTYLNPVTSSPALALHPQTGSVTLTPPAYRPGASSNGYNKYVLVVQIDEYRKVNGVVVKVGSVRRDMFITVVDAGGNNNPTVSDIFKGIQVINANDLINSKPGQPLNLQFNASDLNATDVLELTSDITSVLPGATVTINTAAIPVSGTITYTPIASDIRNAPYYFNIITRDNACSVRGYQMETIGLRITQNGGVTSTKKEIENLSSFIAYPNPSSAELSFKINLKKETNLQSIVIYNSLGQEVDRLSVKALHAGENNITWPNAHKAAAGTYTARIIAADKNSQTIQFSKLQ